MALTVTATWTGGSPTARLLHVFVMTGGKESGGNNAKNTSGFNGNLAFTPNATNSWLVWSLWNLNNNNAFTSIANNTIQDNFSDPGGTRFGDGYYTGTVTGGTGVTVGATVGASGSAVGCAYEIEATGGSTPAIDASTPATVSATSAGTTLTTASFSPPAGAVLVAVIESNNSSTNCTVGDSSSLTWTRRDTTASGVVGIFTATFAGGGSNAAIKYPLPGPVSVAGNRLLNPLRGRRIFTPPYVLPKFGSGPPVPPLHRPVSAPKPPVFSKGRRIYTPPFVPPAQPPKAYPLQGPIGNARRAPGPTRKGRHYKTPGYVAPAFPPAGSGPTVYPLGQPIGLGRRAPGPTRKGQGLATPPYVAPASTPSTAGPKVYPLQQPIGNWRRTKPPFFKGKVEGNPGGPYFPPPNPTVVQQVAGTSTSDYGLSSVDITTTTGNGVVVFAGWDVSVALTDAPVPAVYVADSADNIWYHLGTSSNQGYGSRSAIWVCPNARSMSWVSVALTTYAQALAYLIVEIENLPDFFAEDLSNSSFINVSGPSTTTITAGGSGLFTVPPGVSSLNVQCWAGGAGGSGSDSGATPRGGTGGGGGEYAAEPALAVTATHQYVYTVGIGGNGGVGVSSGAAGIGGAGSRTTFAGDSVTVTAHGGSGGPAPPNATGGAGGTGSTNTVHHNGGAGGGQSSAFHGSGGGGSGGTSAVGNSGILDNKTAAPAVTGGGPGGQGGNSTSPFYGYVPPNQPGGGGGGAGASAKSSGKGGSGATGEIVVSYTVTAPTSVTVPGTTVTADVVFGVMAAGSGTATLSTSPSSPWVALTTVAAGTASAGVKIFPYWITAATAGQNVGTTWGVSSTTPLSAVVGSIEDSPPVPSQPNSTFPLVKIEAALGYTPGDPSQPPPVWTDISSRCISADGQTFISVTYGQEYELASPESGTLTIGINNVDGAFTPGNPASPFYPNIVLGMPVRVSAFWNNLWYPIAFGYVERIPQEWPDLPQWGLSQLTCTDCVSVMTSATMPSALQGDVLIDQPYVYLPLNEQYLTYVNGLQGTSTGALTSYETAESAGLLAANASRINQRAGVYADGTGAVLYQLETGDALNLFGDQGTGAGISSISGNVSYGNPVSGPGVIYQDPNLPNTNSGNGQTIEFWFVYDVAETANQGVTLFSAYGYPSAYWQTNTFTPTSATGPVEFSISLNSTSNEIVLTCNATSINAGTYVPSQGPQHLVVVFPPSNSSSLLVYLNGALIHTATIVAGETGIWNAISGGSVNYGYSANPLVQNFVLGHLAIYPFPLSAGRILAHYNTGATGAQGSTVSQGIASILSWGGLGIPRGGPVNFNGVSDGIFMGPFYSLDGSSAQDGVNNAIQSDTGMVYAAPTGTLIVLPRWALFNDSPIGSLGDAIDGSQIPYVAGQVYGYDNTYLYNIVSVTRQDGPTESVTVTNKNFPSQAAYFTRSALQQTISTTSDLDAYTQSSWELAIYDQPQLRVAQLTIDASSNPTEAFPFVLSTTVSNIITVTRSPIPAAQIAGNFLLQKVDHRIGPTTWETSYQISPYVAQAAVLATDTSGFNVLGANELS